LAARGPAAELTRRTFASVASVFGKLVCLAGLRDASTGRYSHTDLERLLGPEEADRNLRQLHQQVFSQWLRFALADQKADLEDYLRSPGAPRYAACYRTLAPVGAHDVERQLYLTDLETLLELLRLEQFGAVSNRDA
jgi:hypothetical protein